MGRSGVLVLSGKCLESEDLSLVAIEVDVIESVNASFEGATGGHVRKSKFKKNVSKYNAWDHRVMGIF